MGTVLSIKMYRDIVLTLKDGKAIELDAFWLRDHCRCEDCYDAVNYQRKLAIVDIPDDICVEAYKVNEETEVLSVTCKFYLIFNVQGYLFFIDFQGWMDMSRFMTLNF